MGMGSPPVERSGPIYGICTQDTFWVFGLLEPIDIYISGKSAFFHLFDGL